MRATALRSLPRLVVAWTLVAVVSGGIHAANDGASTQDSAEKTGLALCAAAAAVLYAASTCRPSRPEIKEMTEPRLASVDVAPPPVSYSPPLRGAAILRRLRVSRT